MVLSEKEKKVGRNHGGGAGVDNTRKEEGRDITLTTDAMRRRRDENLMQGKETVSAEFKF